MVVAVVAVAVALMAVRANALREDTEARAVVVVGAAVAAAWLVVNGCWRRCDSRREKRVVLVARGAY